MTDKSLYQIALTRIKGVGVTHARALMQGMGDEEAIFKGDIRALESIPGISRRLIQEIRHPEVLERAERELEFVQKNQIQLLFFTDEKYPRRLVSCIDAPLLIYSKGKADFNPSKTISIVGTRTSSRYGEDFCNAFISEIATSFPEVQIVSGLAYGIDICAHRASLKNGLSTVAVLAHGLDRIYPRLHRQTAIEMLDNGALLTEFSSETNADKHNFVKRNRIVAGMSDAVIVMESARKGGSLITADIANSYFREVFALPGRVGDRMSEGCNQLISDNKAVLMRSTESFISQMGWIASEKQKEPVQKELFLDLSEEELRIMEALSRIGASQVNTLAIELDTPVSELFMALLELEMKSLVQAFPGGMYDLV